MENVDIAREGGGGGQGGEAMAGDNRTMDDVIDAVIAQYFPDDAGVGAELARAKSKAAKKRGGAAVRAVVKALERSRGRRDEALRCIDALHALAFCSGDLCTARDFCGNSGIGAATGALRTYSHDAEVKERALQLLTACAASSPEACVKVIAAGGYRAALWVLGDLCWDAARIAESRRLLCACAVFCATLVDYHSECGKNEIDSKYLRPIVASLGECSLKLADNNNNNNWDPAEDGISADDEALRADAVLCTFIKFFSLDWLENLPVVCAAGGITIAVDALTHHGGNPSVVRRACFLLGKLSLVRKSVALEAAEKGAVLPIVDALENVLINTDAVHAVACYALGALAMQTVPDPAVPDAIIANEGLGAISAALSAAAGAADADADADVRDVMKQGTFALAVLASSEAHVPALLEDPNVRGALIGVIRTEAYGRSTCRNVLYTLWHIAAARNAARNEGSEGNENMSAMDRARNAADADAAIRGLSKFPDAQRVQQFGWELLSEVGVPGDRVRDVVRLVAQALARFEGDAAIVKVVVECLAADGCAALRAYLGPRAQPPQPAENVAAVTKLLVSAVRRYPSSEAVQAAGLRALQDVPAMYSCVDYLVDTLAAFPATPAVLEPCLACLVSAADAADPAGDSHNPDVGAALESKRCVQTVIAAAARGRSYAETQRACLRVLSAVAQRGPSAQRRIVGEGGIDMIVSALALNIECTALLEEAYRMLEAFTAPESPVRATAVPQAFDKGAVEVTISAIMGSASDEGLAALACQTLGNVASFSHIYATYACCMGAADAITHAFACFPHSAAVRRGCTPALEKVLSAAGSVGSAGASSVAGIVCQDVLPSDIVDLLNKYPGKEAIQEKGLRTLDVFARSSPARADEVLHYMGAETVAAALARFPASRPVHLAAAALVGSLAEPAGNANAAADRNLPFCGCVKPLAAALATFRADEELLCYVLRALAAACLGPCDTVQAAILGCGGLAAVLSVVQGRGPAEQTAHTALLRQRGCAVLAAVTRGCPEAQAALAASPGGIPAVLAAMEEYPHNAELQVEACYALGNVFGSGAAAASSPAVSQARSADGARAAALVAEALTIDTVEAQVAGCYALAGILRGFPLPDDAACAKVLEAALRALERFPYRVAVQRYGCAVLSEAASSSPAALGALEKDRVIQLALGALQVSHSCETEDEAAAFEAACTVLGALAPSIHRGSRPGGGSRCDLAAARLIYKADVARAVLESPRLGPAALLLLGTLSRGDREVQGAVGEAGGIEALVASLSGEEEDEKTCARALYALHNACDVHGRNEAALVGCAGPSAVAGALARFPKSAGVNRWGVGVLLILARAGPATRASVLSSMDNSENNDESDDDGKDPIDGRDLACAKKVSGDGETSNNEDGSSPNKLVETLLLIIERFSTPPNSTRKEPVLVLRNSLALLSLLSEGDLRVKAFLRGGSRLRALSSAVLSVSADAAALTSGYAALASIARGPGPGPIAPEGAESVLAAALHGMYGAPGSERVQSSALEAAAAVLRHLPPGHRAGESLAAAAFRVLAAFPDSALACERALGILAAVPPRVVFGEGAEAAGRLDAVVQKMNRFVLRAPLVAAGCQVLGAAVREVPELRARLGQRGGLDVVRRAVAAHPQAEEELRRCGEAVVEGLVACDVVRTSFEG